MAKASKGFTEKRKKELVLLGVALVAIIGISYAWLTQTITSSNSNVIVAGNLLLTLNNESPIVKIDSTSGYGVPISDSAGLSSTPYTFTVENTGTVNAKYSIYLDNVDSYTNSSNQSVSITSSNRIADTKIDYNLRIGTDTSSTIAKLNTLGNPRLLVTNQQLTPGQTKTYHLRLWIDKDAVNADVDDKVFAAKIRIEATQTENPTIPTGA